MYVTREMSVGEIVEKYPEAVEVMLRHGLHCVGCHFNPMDTLEGGSRLHGIPAKEVEEMLGEINEAIGEKRKNGGGDLDKESAGSENPDAGKLAVLTPEAAQELSAIMASEGKAGYALRVACVDNDCGCGSHSFYMEFEEAEKPGDLVEQAHGMKVIVSQKIAEQIRGTTIDFANGGFTMRNPNAKQACQCGQHAGA